MIKSGIFTIIFIATQTINTTAAAANKCLINGQINYQDTDCPKGTDQAPKPQPKSTAPLNLSDPAQRKTMVDKMEKDFNTQLKIARSQPRNTTSDSTTTNTAPSEKSTPMPFDQCVASVNRTVRSLPLQLRNASHIVDSGILTVTKVCTVEGAVLVACNKADDTMIISRVTAKC